jgi:ribosomal protein L7/L12
MNNYYSQAIQVLADSNTDFRAIAYEIAKANPKALAQAAERIKGVDWASQCIPLMRAGQKIEAIKLCRSLTGMSLIEAKNAVEAIERR